MKKERKKIVHCHGTYDLLHLGHIKHLTNAKKYGDILIVTITADKFINKIIIADHILKADKSESISYYSHWLYLINHDFTAIDNQVFASRLLFMRPDYDQKMMWLKRLKMK